jgi:hypothetical protein
VTDLPNLFNIAGKLFAFTNGPFAAKSGSKVLAKRPTCPSCEDLSDKPVVSIKLSKATVTI